MSAMKHLGWGFATLVGFTVHPILGVLMIVGWALTAVSSRPKVKSETPVLVESMGASQVPIAEPAGGVRSAYTVAPGGGLERVRLSSKGRIGAVGEYYRRKEIRALVGKGVRIGQVGNWDAGLPIEVELVPEPRNRHDRNAVALVGVYGGRREIVGYLARQIAPQWQPRLLEMQQQGQTAFCSAMVYRNSDPGFQVVLRLADPEEAFFWNGVPRGAVALDAERMASAIGVHRHQDALGVVPDGLMWATLAAGEVWSGKYAGDPTIDVSIEGVVVGQLNASQGARYSPVLEMGSPVACEASVFQGTRNRQVKIWLPKVD